MTEAQLHRSVAAYLSLALPDDVYFSTVGHGGFPLNQVTAINMKRAGVKAGVPDCMFVIDGRAHFIELKREGSYTSAVQKQAHGDIKRAGGQVVVCRSLDDVIGTLKAWGVKLKAEAA